MQRGTTGLVAVEIVALPAQHHAAPGDAVGHRPDDGAEVAHRAEIGVEGVAPQHKRHAAQPEIDEARAPAHHPRGDLPGDDLRDLHRAAVGRGAEGGEGVGHAASQSKGATATRRPSRKASATWRNGARSMSTPPERTSSAICA